jgi:hypothetical protein
VAVLCRFDGLESFGLQYERVEWLGDKGTCCRLRVQKAKTGKEVATR